MGSLFSKTPYSSDASTFATQVQSESSSLKTAETAEKLYKAYDYIIVGAGAAGCVLASRLSENPDVTILLVEAGGSHEGQTFSKIPIAFGKIFKTAGDWAYFTTPQPGLNGRELYWPRGKMLGGSTSINAMCYQHCSPSDFDEWERKGAVGWSYKDLAPYFRMSEKFTPHLLYPGVKREERGEDGLWHTGYMHCAPITNKFIEASQEVGIPHNPDINTPRGSVGVSRMMTFIDQQGQRSSTATAYLLPDVVARPNLTIAIETTTTRVLFSSDAVPRAIGIEMAKDASSPRFRAAARKEVILSAGALNTPQLLNLSGIGAREELEKFNVDVVKDLPSVGKNLSDHLITGSITFRAKTGTTLDYMTHPIKSLFAILQWFTYGTGPATSNVAEAAAFVRSLDKSLPFTSPVSPAADIEDATSGATSPDLELLSAPLAFLQHGLELPPAGSNCFTIAPALLCPLSTGRVYLTDSSPFIKPHIDANYLSHPNDLKIMVRGVRLTLRIGRATALQGMLDLKPHSEDKTDLFWPGDANPDKVADADLEEWVRNHAETLYHPVGTARIGTDEKVSVVDPQLRVHGFQGLRIVDASIFPSQIAGHPTATVIAIAEKASQMILRG